MTLDSHRGEATFQGTLRATSTNRGQNVGGSVTQQLNSQKFFNYVQFMRWVLNLIALVASVDPPFCGSGRVARGWAAKGVGQCLRETPA